MRVALILSVIGFGGILVVDVNALRERPRARALLFTLALTSLSVALVQALIRGKDLIVPSSWRFWVGGILTLAGGLLALYTVLVEIPLWQKRNAGQASALVTMGTYAACRHPGFWGTSLFVLGLSVLVPAPHMWVLAVTWFLLELIVVFVQDRWIFPTMFPEYKKYQQCVPFLLPTRHSLRKAWLSYRECFRGTR